MRDTEKERENEREREREMDTHTHTHTHTHTSLDYKESMEWECVAVLVGIVLAVYCIVLSTRVQIPRRNWLLLAYAKIDSFPVQARILGVPVVFLCISIETCTDFCIVMQKSAIPI